MPVDSQLKRLEEESKRLINALEKNQKSLADVSSEITFLQKQRNDLDTGFFSRIKNRKSLKEIDENLMTKERAQNGLKEQLAQHQEGILQNQQAIVQRKNVLAQSDKSPPRNGLPSEVPDRTPVIERTAKKGVNFTPEPVSREHYGLSPKPVSGFDSTPSPVLKDQYGLSTKLPTPRTEPRRDPGPNPEAPSAPLDSRPLPPISSLTPETAASRAMPTPPGQRLVSKPLPAKSVQENAIPLTPETATSRAMPTSPIAQREPLVSRPLPPLTPETAAPRPMPTPSKPPLQYTELIHEDHSQPPRSGQALTDETAASRAMPTPPRPSKDLKPIPLLEKEKAILRKQQQQIMAMNPDQRSEAHKKLLPEIDKKIEDINKKIVEMQGKISSPSETPNDLSNTNRGNYAQNTTSQFRGQVGVIRSVASTPAKDTTTEEKPRF